MIYLLTTNMSSHTWVKIVSIFLPAFIVASASIPAIDTGLGLVPPGPEESVKDFAILSDDLVTDLPSKFTICSSISTDAFTTGLSPFLLTRESGEPWITFAIWPPNKGSTMQRIQTKVA